MITQSSDKSQTIPTAKTYRQEAQKIQDLDLSYQPLPGSTKKYRSGEIYPDLRIPYREVALSATHHPDQTTTPNLPVALYDPSGPYTDSNIKINILEGLSGLRKPWILGRGDVEILEQSTS
ncbi:MAG: hypothetical protein NUV91_05250, partial [Candidatus Omnitrophica bacterium]|nr:hypothetical protein [Candidatus Omnitrophota bacterium]